MDKTFQKILKEFVDLGHTCLSYASEPKARFHRLGKLVAARVAVELGLPEGSYDIRSNKGGIAVCGEVTLHAENLYIQFSQSACGSGMDILYRFCKDRKDYTGGRNNYLTYETLAKFDKAVQSFKAV